MIDGLAQNELDSEALILFYQMQEAGYALNQVTLVSVLQACSHLGSLQQGKWIHDLIIQCGLLSIVKISNSLVAMYAKCGSLSIARQMFDSMPRTDLVSWNAMIVGYAQNGHANQALELFQQMRLSNIRPSSVTILSVLQSCAHLASLQKVRSGLAYADPMVSCSWAPYISDHGNVRVYGWSVNAIATNRWLLITFEPSI